MSSDCENLADAAAAASLRTRQLMRAATVEFYASLPISGHSDMTMAKAKKNYNRHAKAAAAASVVRDELLDKLLDASGAMEPTEV